VWDRHAVERWSPLASPFSRGTSEVQKPFHSPPSSTMGNANILRGDSNFFYEHSQQTYTCRYNEKWLGSNIYIFFDSARVKYWMLKLHHIQELKSRHGMDPWKTILSQLQVWPLQKLNLTPGEIMLA
jgi:hypothetical protein